MASVLKAGENRYGRIRGELCVFTRTTHLSVDSLLPDIHLRQPDVLQRLFELGRGSEHQICHFQAVVDDLIGDLLRGWHKVEVRLGVFWHMGVVRHHQRNIKSPRSCDCSEHEAARSCYVDDVWLEPLADALRGSGEVEAECDCAVPGEGEAVVAVDGEVQKLVGWVFALIGGQDVDIVSGLVEEPQHLLEAVGISANVIERCGFNEESDPHRRSLLQGHIPGDAVNEEKQRQESRHDETMSSVEGTWLEQTCCRSGRACSWGQGIPAV